MVEPQVKGIPESVNAVWGSFPYSRFNFPMSGRLINKARPLGKEAMFATSGIDSLHTNTFALVVYKEFPRDAKL